MSKPEPRYVFTRTVHVESRKHPAGSEVGPDDLRPGTLDSLRRVGHLKPAAAAGTAAVAAAPAEDLAERPAGVGTAGDETRPEDFAGEQPQAAKAKKPKPARKGGKKAPTEPADEADPVAGDDTAVEDLGATT